MKEPRQSCNNLLVGGSQRCNPMRVKSIRVLLSEQEMATLEHVRALGFSSHAELLRCATLAWADAAAELPNEEPTPDGCATCSASTPAPP
jgi:hypothetical protein